MAHLLVPQLLLVYQLFTENSAAFVLLIGLELKAAKEVLLNSAALIFDVTISC